VPIPELNFSCLAITCPITVEIKQQTVYFIARPTPLLANIAAKSYSCFYFSVLTFISFHIFFIDSYNHHFLSAFAKLELPV
jgi:hypothetical protein